MSKPSADRVPCLAPGCPNTIQPATATRNGGYCGPCAGQRALAAHNEFVRANRRDVDRYAGVTDPVELLRLMHTPPLHDPIVNLLPAPKSFDEMYVSLSAADAERLIRVATSFLKNDPHKADEIGSCLAAFTKFNLDPMLANWLDHRRAYPGLIFRRAGAVIRDRLLTSLRSWLRPLDANHVLSALAWIGDANVAAALRAADVNRPKWSRALKIPPSGYARVAGWELTADGHRRELTLPMCVALQASIAAPPSDHVQVMQPRTDDCPWCGGRLANLIGIDLRTAEPLLGALRQFGELLEVMTCPACTCYGTVHGELDAHGRGRWASANVKPSYLPDDSADWEPSPWAGATIQVHPRDPLYAAQWTLPTTLSQIGGHPAWVQDFAYPNCHRCAQTMSFLAQIDQAVFPGYEGVYYAFTCLPCRTTATTYQQT